ncbi:MAG: DUF459 domain-containing protein [Actinobacteria bacterium]|nr:DUF459 domain-containing protein [Actinomycetota bacterium]
MDTPLPPSTPPRPSDEELAEPPIVLPDEELPATREVPPPPAARWAAGHVIITVTIALLLGALLNAADILATAERQPFGPARNASVAAAERLLAVSSALRLDRPRSAIDEALGRGPAEVAEDEPAEEPVIAAPATPSPADEVTEEPTAEPEPEPTRGPYTAADPLTMYIGGDSMVGQFGGALADLADDTGVITMTEVKYEFGSGLSRPDFVDWPERLRGVSRTQQPEVMVLFFGGNDAQPLEIDGTVYEPETPEWQAEYRSRVSALMEELQELGHTVYWMGMPIPRSETLQVRHAILNEIYSSEADLRDSVHFVASWDLFKGPDGGFSEYLPNRNGEVVDMRLDDGIHLTTAGAYRLARPTIARIMADHGIEPADEQGG